MKKFSYLLIAQDPDGRTNEVTTNLIAILGGDTKEEIERIALRTIAKHMAGGDYTRITEQESWINEEERGYLHYSIASDNPGLPVVPGAFYFLQSIEMNEWPRRGKNDYVRHMPYVVQDEKTGIYRHITDFRNPDIQAYPVDVADIDALDSPFIYASPFIVKGKDLYAVDAETGVESGPYSKVFWDFACYAVDRDGKVGLVSFSGRQIADCVYDGAFYSNGFVVLSKDGKIGLYSPWHNVLIPCQYDVIECPADDDEYVHATKDGVVGLLATDGSFHPLTDEDPDEDYSLLSIDY